MLSLHKLLPYLDSNQRFLYESYDFKMAKEEYKQNASFYPNYNDLFDVTGFDIPDEIKKKHVLLKVGRLFKYSPSYIRFHIGHRYPKNFQLNDFGDSVKIILYPIEKIYTEIYHNKEKIIPIGCLSSSFDINNISFEDRQLLIEMKFNVNGIDDKYVHYMQ